jgi:hemerythrin-like domain-containing protein
MAEAMADKEYKLEMSMMFAVHEALRRELVRINRVANQADGDPRKSLRSALGWELFKKFLDVHHVSEDLAVWPVLHERVAGDSEKTELINALEAEHAGIDPLLKAIDEAAADLDSGYQRFGDLVDELITSLNRHLDHEESDGLDLIDATLTPEEWLRFAVLHSDRIGTDSSLYMPWLLDDASPQTLSTILGGFPEQLLTAYREQWGPHYSTLTLWDKTRA